MTIYTPVPYTYWCRTYPIRRRVTVRRRGKTFNYWSRPHDRAQ